MANSRLQPDVDLIGSFLNGTTDARAFERAFLDRYKNDDTHWSEAEFAILDGLFFAVDGFSADPNLRGPADLDEGLLRQECRHALERLVSLPAP